MPCDVSLFEHTGSIELFIKDTAGQIVLTVAEAGGVFGELSLLDSGPRTATAVAVTDAELLVLDRDDLLLLFQRRPDAALHKAELEVAHLHEKTDRLYEAMLTGFARLEQMTMRTT